MPRLPKSKTGILDDFDRAILRILQLNAKTPQRSIARSVNLSPAAVQRRIAAMEAMGVIDRTTVAIEPSWLNLAITSVVEVRLIDEKAATVDAAKAQFRSEPEIQQCYYVTGGTSFILIIVSPTMADYESATRRMLSENPLVASYHSNIALDRVKVGLDLVIPFLR